MKQKNSSWKDTAEFVGIAAIVASLLFVGLQMRQEQDIAIAQIWAMADQTVAEMSGLVAENRDLWVKGLKGEELTEVDRVAFRSIAFAVFRRHGNIVNRIERLDYGGTTEERARRLAFDLYQYPGLRQAYEELQNLSESRSSAFGAEQRRSFGSQVDEALADLDRSKPPAPDRLYVPL